MKNVRLGSKITPMYIMSVKDTENVIIKSLKLQMLTYYTRTNMINGIWNKD